MRIGYVLSEFPPLSETFIRREVLGLAELGHSIVVYTHQRHRDPLVVDPSGPRLSIREVSFLQQREPTALIHEVRQDGIEHLHSSLSIHAHKAAYATAGRLQIPFTLTAYSGYDIFTARDPRLYHDISRDPLCQGIVIEDSYMQQWLAERLGADPDRLVTIANSFDLDLYRLSQPRPLRDLVVILAIARFVEKKGLIHLVRAFQKVKKEHPLAECWIVGRGPEEEHLRQAANSLNDPDSSQIRFMGAVSEERTRELYAEADIFCLPCIRSANGDGDGIPTTILEAMAFELPVVSSDLLSTPYYITSGQEGYLTEPGDEEALAAALCRLIESPQLRLQMGQAARARVAVLCDLHDNLNRLEALMLAGRKRRWLATLDGLVARRLEYTSAELQRYALLRERAAVFYHPPSGRLLDIGCGYGSFDGLFEPGVQYFGLDPLRPPDNRSFPFCQGLGEELPFANNSFDSLMIYGSLIHVLDVSAVLQEARRVLKPGGMAFFHETLNDPNPLHLNHFTQEYLLNQVADSFEIIERQVLDSYLMLRVRKPFVTVAMTMCEPVDTLSLDKPAGFTRQAAVADPVDRPLVSIGITVYNRQLYLREAIESVLGQNYHPMEVVVVDDGSTDESRTIIESYGGAVKAIYHEGNRGIAAAKNSVLRATSSEARYVGILDSDDVYLPAFVACCVDLLESSPNVGLVYTDDILIDAAGRPIAQRQAVEPWTVEGWLRTCNLRGDTWLARRTLVMQTRLHDERLCFDVDYDLFYQLLRITCFAHLKEPLVKIRQHNGQSTRASLELAKYHAANLVRYGYSPEYAFLRARHYPEWIPAIEEGIRLGQDLRAEDNINGGE